MKNKAVFLDRDGTINKEKKYLYRIEDFEFLPGVIESLKLLQEAGYLLIVITNQSGIARGYYTESDFYKLNNWMSERLREEGINLTAVYYCPHLPDAKIQDYRTDCECRKPKLGMFLKAIEEYKIDLSKSYAIGDKIRDCTICKETECKGFLIGDNEDETIIIDAKKGKLQGVQYAQNLMECTSRILNNFI